jgi:hypothetical protein
MGTASDVKNVLKKVLAVAVTGAAALLTQTKS